MAKQKKMYVVYNESRGLKHYYLCTYRSGPVCTVLSPIFAKEFTASDANRQIKKLGKIWLREPLNN